LFFALWPDAAVRDHLYAAAQARHRECGGRVMRRDNLHLTLVFLGSVTHDKIPALDALARQLRGDAFALAFGTTGYWRRNRIVYAAPHAVPAPLLALVAALEKALTNAQFAFDQRPYVPHITLIRDARVPATLPPLAFNWPVVDFTLVESGRDAKGVAYRVRARWPLQGRIT
jgi:2'-5' RNA ligase